MSVGATWAVSAHAGRAGHLSPIWRTLGENVGEYWWKMTGLMAQKMIGAASWDSSMVWLTLVVILGAVGTRVGPRLQKLSDGHPLVQGLLTARNGQVLACMHFTPGRCVHHLVFMRGTVPEVTAGSMFLGPPADGFAEGVWPPSDFFAFEYIIFYSPLQTDCNYTSLSVITS